MIDNIFFNSIEHYVISGNIVYDLTDHLPNFIIVNRLTEISPNINIYRRDYSNFNEDKFVEEVKLVEWQQLLCSETDPSSMFTRFFNRLSLIIDKHIPIRQLTKKELK